MKKSTIFHAISLAFLLTGCASAKVDEPIAKSEQPSLQVLILQGRDEEAKNLFITDINVNQLDSDRNTALHAAAAMGSVDMVDYLLAKGADPSIRNKDGNTPIHIAILNRKYETLRALAEFGDNIFITDSHGMNAIDRIFEIDGDLFYNALITPKTISITNSDGQTMVHYFVQKKNLTAIQKCATLGVDLSVRNAEGLTPLEFALQDPSDVVNARIAAELIKSKCEPIRGDFSYFEDTVRTYNVNLRFSYLANKNGVQSRVDDLTPLHMAVIKGHLGIAKFLYENGASLTAQDSHGHSPLHVAAESGRNETAKFFLENGANVDARDQNGCTPLLLDIPENAHLDVYTTLLNHNGNVHAKDIHGNTLLHKATANRVNTLILSRLVKQGADIDARNDDGVTPLLLAVSEGLIEQVAFLVDLGADINAKDKKGNSPLSVAIQKANQTKILSLVQALINPSNVDSRDSEGNTVLHQAVEGNLDLDIIRYFINCGADLNARNRKGKSILYTAVENNNKAAGQFLIKEGADIYARNSEGFSPLRKAMTAGGEIRDWFFMPMVINGSDGNGNTPLHYAASWCYDECISYILAKGGNIDKKNALGETPLYYAAKENSVSTIKLLIEKGANPNARDLLNNTPLHQSVQWDTFDATRTLVAMGATIDAKNVSGKTPLSMAATYNTVESAKILLENKANVNNSDITGKSILMDAVLNDSVKVIPVLLAYGANVNSQDMYGRNSYHEAAELKDVEIIRVLAEYGGNALSRDSFGKTPFSLVANENKNLIYLVLGKNKNLIDSDGNNPLHIAVSCKAKADVMTALIENGYDINQRNSQGLTPLNYAIKEKQNSLAKILIQNGADPFIADNNGDCAITLAFNDIEVQDVLDSLIRKFKDEADFQGDTILHYAARSGNEETIKHILTFDLNKFKLNNVGETPFEIAKRWKNRAGVDLLK